MTAPTPSRTPDTVSENRQSRPFTSGRPTAPLNRPSPRGARSGTAYVPERFTFDRSFPITVLEFLQLSHPTCPREKIADYLNHLNIAATLDSKL